MIFKFDIEPVAQARPRATKVGKSIRMYDPKKTANFKTDLKMMAQIAKKVRKYKIPDGAISVNIQVVRRVPRSWTRKKQQDAISGMIYPVTKPDLSNYIKSIEDALNGVLWQDDNATVQLISSKKYGQSGRVVVEVNKI
ncbi:RusA family crossover junction endodeoxyribonuclease [Leuconostoc mesenteroides]|jgi:Holliday junction resolvase RusA-like endonuclease|uniref:RusA family crossover junction endodeoxyribonuclease n=1 Tax=Leuconostoc mesenteroides TaxID=1245 RepID=UPI001FBB24BC|nr:RusA family crossover junction endodeoxyribonuclease [Leuconostoc mesenteroides]MCJ2158595.1 RusA family crossover junction endodeoxyribonuclease [Leuconostoc mesenteroides]MCM6835980.1 RusA family crossover junction endodeoxyribonuclease [Leuconostoc mesenteroides]